MNLTELSKQIRFDDASQGFDPTEGGVDRYLLLVISEICEAQEKLRDGHSPQEIYYTATKDAPLDYEYIKNKTLSEYVRKHCKPEGFPVEIADAIIRLLDICGKFEIEVVIAEITSYRFVESIDFYLLRTCKTIAQCQYGTFAGLQTYEFQHNLVTAITFLIQLAQHHKIDIRHVIDEKLAFNKTRPPKHGRKF